MNLINRTIVNLEVIAVDENFRSKGYGKALLNALIKESFSHSGIDEIDLVVENVNQTALGLYYSFGFELKVENCFYQEK